MMTADHLRLLEENPENRIVLARWMTDSTLIMATDESGVPFLLAACRGQGMTPLAIVRARRPWIERQVIRVEGLAGREVVDWRAAERATMPEVLGHD